MTDSFDERDRGIARVSANNAQWMADCFQEVLRMRENARAASCFIGEDLRLHLRDVVGSPAHHNAWGALIKSLKHGGVIYQNGLFRNTRTLPSHARLAPCYSFCGELAMPESYVALLK
jgi:hypothetical protein